MKLVAFLFGLFVLYIVAGQTTREQIPFTLVMDGTIEEITNGFIVSAKGSTEHIDSVIHKDKGIDTTVRIGLGTRARYWYQGSSTGSNTTFTGHGNCTFGFTVLGAEDHLLYFTSLGGRVSHDTNGHWIVMDSMLIVNGKGAFDNAGGYLGVTAWTPVNANFPTQFKMWLSGVIELPR